MKKILFLILGIILLFLSCHQPKKEKTVSIKSEKIIKENKSKSNIADNLLVTENTSKNKKQEVAPIQIIKTILLKNDYSHHKDIKIVYKNSSKKAIKAIKMDWFCINAFEKPANGHYFYGEGNFKGDVTNLIKPGETKSEIWEDFSTDADKIIRINVNYVVYNDGTKWELVKDKVSL